MTKMQNLVVLMDPPDSAWNVSVKGGNMLLNRFCIDEDAGFELSGISFLKKESFVSKSRPPQVKEKGKEYLSCSRI